MASLDVQPAAPAAAHLELALVGAGSPRLVLLQSADGRDLLEVRLDEAGLTLRYSEDGLPRLEAALNVGLAYATRLVGDATYGFSFTDPIRHDEGDDPGSLVIKQLRGVLERSTRACLALPRLTEVLDACGRHLSTQVVQDAWRLACTYHSLTRRSVYRFLVTDPSGRLEQLARTAPGVLTLLCKLDEARFAGTPRLRQAVVDGWPLKRLADEVVVRYLQACNRCREVSPALSLGRLLALRASPLVPASCILPLSTGYLASDIPPRDDPMNPLWYRAMCALALTPREHHPAYWQAMRILTRHVSRHLAELLCIADELRPELDGDEEMDRSPRGAACMFYDDTTRLGFLLSRLLHYLVASGANPGRATHPRRLVERALDWEAAGWERDFLHLEGPCGAGRLPDAVPTPVGLVVEEIATWERLRAESRDMRHCIFPWLADEGGLDGRVVLHLTWQEQHHATALLEPTGTSWRLVEVSGPCNAVVPDGLVTSLRGWVAGLHGSPSWR